MAFMVKLGETRLPFSTKGRGCHGDGFHHDLQRFWGVFPSGDHTGRLTTPEASRGRQELGFAQLSIDPSSKKGSTVPPSPATNNSPVEGQPPWCHSPGSGAVLFGSHASNWGYTVSSPPSNGNLWNPPNRMCYCVLYLSIHPSIHLFVYLSFNSISRYINHHSPSFTDLDPSILSVIPLSPWCHPEDLLMAMKLEIHRIQMVDHVLYLSWWRKSLRQIHATRGILNILKYICSTLAHFLPIGWAPFDAPETPDLCVWCNSLCHCNQTKGIAIGVFGGFLIHLSLYLCLSHA